MQGRVLALGAWGSLLECMGGAAAAVGAAGRDMVLLKAACIAFKVAEAVVSWLGLAWACSKQVLTVMLQLFWRRGYGLVSNSHSSRRHSSSRSRSRQCDRQHSCRSTSSRR